MQRQLIIAGDIRQARTCAKMRGLKGDEYTVVNDSFDLDGVRRGETVWLYGTYYARKDLRHLMVTCRARDLKAIEVVDSGR